MKPHGDLTVAEPRPAFNQPSWMWRSLIHPILYHVVSKISSYFPKYLDQEPPDSKYIVTAVDNGTQDSLGKGYLMWSLLREKVFPDLHIFTQNKIQDSARPEPLGRHPQEEEAYLQE